MRYLIIFSLSIALFACSLYESEGRKIFNKQGKSLIEAQAFEPLDQENFQVLTENGFYDCEKIDVEEAHFQLDPSHFRLFKTEQESFYIDQRDSLALITSHHQSFEACLF